MIIREESIFILEKGVRIVVTAGLQDINSMYITGKPIIYTFNMLIIMLPQFCSRQP